MVITGNLLTLLPTYQNNKAAWKLFLQICLFSIHTNEEIKTIKPAESNNYECNWIKLLHREV